MTPRDFAYWLMGSLELVDPKDGLNETQTQTLKNHLDMVFVHMVNEDGSLKPEAPYYTSKRKPIEPKSRGIHPYLRPAEDTGWYGHQVKINC